MIPKIHCSRISDLPPEYAAATGETISRVGKALTQGMFTRLRTMYIVLMDLNGATYDHRSPG